MASDARPMVTFPATDHHCPLAGTKLYCLVTAASHGTVFIGYINSKQMSHDTNANIGNIRQEVKYYANVCAGLIFSQEIYRLGQLNLINLDFERWKEKCKSA